MKVIAAIDQGTTGTTVLLLDQDQRVVGRGYREIPQHFPTPGWVEHDPRDHIDSAREALAEALEQAGATGDRPTVEAVGITNQRETVVLWDRQTGEPVAPAVVWQDRRTQDVCAELRQAGHEPAVQAQTGLVIDPYFSATKIAWLLDNQAGLRARAERGELAFGTVDSWLCHQLSGGRDHITDASNASRTLLYDINTRAWSQPLCDLFRVPAALLPRVVPSSGDLTRTAGLPGVADGTPVAGIAGDQQAALYGHGCWAPGQAKCTYGTGAFLLANIGAQPTVSRQRLLTTVAWWLEGPGAGPGDAGPGFCYALEGSAFVAGALVQWLRDGLGIIDRASQVEALARAVPDAGGVTIVPALAGLGAPHWRPEARGLVAGITRGTTRAHIARAALEAIALQIVELVRAMEADAGQPVRALRVDGGAAANDLLMQLQADLLGVEVQRPAFVELTALGAARLAARPGGFFRGTAEGAAAAAPTTTQFQPTLDADARARRLASWREVVAKA
jgi:glycerol kinase